METSETSEAEGRAAAEAFRAEHGLALQPLGDLVALIEQVTGFDVAVLETGPDEHGLTMRDPVRDAVFIGVACTRRPMRQRSTLAHELAHVLFGDWTDDHDGDWADRRYEERRADAFARHLLLPLDGVGQFVADRGFTPATLSNVVQWFLASPAMAVIQLHEGKHIDVAVKDQWMATTTPQLAARFGWSDQYAALQAESDHPRAPQRLLARAIVGYAESVVPVQTIATLRGVRAAEAEAELRGAGVVPAPQRVSWAEAGDVPDAEVDLAELDRDLAAPEDREG
ncbi:ImmA/IrrE family metallo-endopeptidase [Amycolatopsis silviterrae]|uniref:ImmA/IrrE family metallo-endopeptidase n=1 Tax=Amycolatopsis silviterrae TaxID=1656914 RepID=A0ABW5HEX3_9PSEU